MVHSQQVGNEQAHLTAPCVGKETQDCGTEDRADGAGSSGDLLLRRCESAAEIRSDVRKGDTNDTSVITVEETAESSLGGSVTAPYDVWQMRFTAEIKKYR